MESAPIIPSKTHETHPMKSEDSAHGWIHRHRPLSGEPLQQRQEPREVAHGMQRGCEFLRRVGEGRFEVRIFHVLQRARKGVMCDDIECHGCETVVQNGWSARTRELGFQPITQPLRLLTDEVSDARYLLLGEEWCHCRPAHTVAARCQMVLLRWVDSCCLTAGARWCRNSNGGCQFDISTRFFYRIESCWRTRLARNPDLRCAPPKG
jgi:hypothetical protein